MKKIIINEDWEEVEVPDLSNFFVLIFKQGSDKAGYIKCYDTDEAPVFTEYDNLVNQYSNVKFDEPTSINVIKVPATGQVKAMLEETPYTGDETNKDKIETINHLLGRADCECLKEKVLMSLEEAKKKKKKKKKAPRVTYTMGFPYLNDHRFNHACGTCDCGKDAADDMNDAIGGGEAAGEGSGDGSLGGEGGGEGGAMGESLINEATMTPLEKMQALEKGTRGFNAAAASDAKLVNNLNICTKNNLPRAAAIMRDEIQRRMNTGVWALGQVANLNTTPAPKAPQPAAPQLATSTKIDLDTFDFWYAGQYYLDDLAARILKNYVDDGDIDSFVEVLSDPKAFAQSRTTPQISLSYFLANLLFAICFNYPEAIQALRDAIIKIFGFSSAELKQYIKDKLLSNSAIMSKVRKAIEVVLNENLQKEDKSIIVEALTRLDEAQSPALKNINLADPKIISTIKLLISDYGASQVWEAEGKPDGTIKLIVELNRVIKAEKMSPEEEFGYILAHLLLAMYLNMTETMIDLKYRALACGVSSAQLKDFIKGTVLTDTALVNTIQKIVRRCREKYESIKEQTPKMNLTEAKRYIKRYYIRPQNVFASNKAEILQRLAEVEADGANCSVYSLKALEDHDDVHLLQPKDIIYYYDAGVLYDKNHVPVLDYDLNVKNEEERPKISAEATSDERFKDVYQDRMTDRTFAEAFENDFYVDFDDVNAFGIKLTEGKEAEYTCCICGDDFEGYGNNPSPYKESGKCCDACNRKFVIPARLMQLQDQDEE